MKISLVIITYNPNLKYFDKIINNLPNNTEIIIVSNFIKQNIFYNKCKFYFHHSKSDFSELKNFALSKAKGDWILTVDDDEDLSIETLQLIPLIIENNNIDGYWFKRKKYISSSHYLKYGLFYPDWQLRLFRNNHYLYCGAVHAHLNIPIEKTQKVAANILHYPIHPKYSKWSDFRNLMPYVKLESIELRLLKKSGFWYYRKGLEKFCILFFGGYLRGKGILDGWAGFRAHLMFAWSIALAYFMAAGKDNPADNSKQTLNDLIRYEN